ncbi:RDD family protein [Parenemella sanctibonifatiensis]|uniref:RDD family protein n=1 Tax=Parenemella sanctibonifatiensis TaxID=2016505 RepID=A0A255ENR0_9ACTN|nr:RDD family protein [Parenemella sanctibonifatiensis]OYN89763.1 RDD family protein [Parenemella sanctibonifatiensis]
MSPKTDTATWPGARMGLPESGVGAVASWWSRVAALIADWAIAMILAVVAFGPEVVTGGGWHRWMTLTIFFVLTSVMLAITGGTPGHLLAGIGVVRPRGGPVGWRAPIRQLGLCLVLPGLIIDGDRRHVPDMVLDLAVVQRRAPRTA